MAPPAPPASGPPPAASPPRRVCLTADWLTSPAAQAVTEAIEGGGHRALFVGGCVRNAFLGAPVTDLDLATDARPERVMALADAAGLKAVPTGIDHGTVTLVHKGHPIEVTTFRADIATDGRHAQVRFSDRVEEDARRRDFTMNALYCDRAGWVIDPLGGLSDLYARRLRFVGDPVSRVREDYLRILRFFRFHAWYADPNGGMDADGLAACASEADGIARLSAERVGAEMKKLLAAPDPGQALSAMAHAGVLARVLPGSDVSALLHLVAFEQAAARAPDPILRLAALGGDDPAARLRLSRAEGRRRDALRMAAEGTQGAKELGWRLGVGEGWAALALRAALLGQPMPEGADMALSEGAAATFPVTAHDLMGDYSGPAIGRRLAALETAWIASGLTLSRDALLALPDR